MDSEKYTPEEIAFMDQCAIHAPESPNWFYESDSIIPKTPDRPEADLTPNEWDEEFARIQNERIERARKLEAKWPFFYAKQMLEERRLAYDT